MESVATEDLLLATLLTDDGSGSGTTLSTASRRSHGEWVEAQERVFEGVYAISSSSPRSTLMRHGGVILL